MAYFLVTETRGPEWDNSRPRRGQRNFAEHAASMDRLVDEGTILLGGPVGTDPDAGDVLLVIEASNEDAVYAALSVDLWIGDHPHRRAGGALDPVAATRGHHCG